MLYIIYTCTCISQSSWRRQLRTKFKNLRRPDRASKAGIVVPPPPQKAKTAVSTGISEYSEEPSSSLVAEYERHIQFLQRSYASKKWSVSSMITLMEQTADMRREWVQKDEPSVSQVLEKFPCLADPRIVRFYQLCEDIFTIILCVSLYRC